MCLWFIEQQQCVLLGAQQVEEGHSSEHHLFAIRKFFVTQNAGILNYALAVRQRSDPASQAQEQIIEETSLVEFHQAGKQFEGCGVLASK